MIKKNEGDRKALLDIKTHALAYLKYIPKTKELKTEIAVSKTEEEFYNVIEKIKKHIISINSEN